MRSAARSLCVNNVNARRIYEAAYQRLQNYASMKNKAIFLKLLSRQQAVKTSNVHNLVGLSDYVYLGDSRSPGLLYAIY